MKSLASLAALPLLLCLLGGCARRPSHEGLEGLRKAIDTFDQRVRWKDYRGAMQLLAPERREAFDEARSRGNDEQDLSVTEIETEDAQLTPDGQRAIVVSRYSWLRLPSTTVKNERVTSEWVSLGGTWFLSRQVGGPFEAELGL